MVSARRSNPDRTPRGSDDAGPPARRRGALLDVLRRRTQRAGGLLGLLVAPALALAVVPGRAAAAPGPAFDGATPSVFVSHQPAGSTTTQLSEATQANGAITFGDLGPLSSVTYNGIAYDSTNNLLYAASGGGGGTSRGDVIQIGSDGVPSDTGVNMSTALGGPVGATSAAAGFDPDTGMIYWAADPTLSPALAAFNPATNAISGPIALSQLFAGEDLTWTQGFLWSWGNIPGQPPGPATMAIARIDPTTGTVTNFPVPASLFPGCGVPGAGVTAGCTSGADFTYGNGNLGFDENANGNIYQIAVSNASSATPTFALVSHQAGIVARSIDATASPGEPTDLAMHKTVSPQTVGDGGSVTYTLTVSNGGPGNSSGYTVSDTLPPGLINPTTTAPGCTIAAGVLTCSGSPLANGATSAPITVTGTVPNPFVTPITNTATVTGNENDPNLPNNTTGVTSTPSADLSIDKTAATMPAIPGENETYTLIARNAGPDTAVNAVVSDPLPSGLSFVSASQGCTFAAGTVTCAAGNMAPGATTAFHVVAKVAASQTTTLTNTATIASPTPDPNPPNNRHDTPVPVNPETALQIAKAASAPKVTAGGQVMYTLVVTNTGPSDAHGVKVSDLMPAGLSAISAKPSQGSCSGTTCNLGTVADGGSAQVLVTADVDLSAAGQTLTNCATVSDSGSGKGAGCAPIVVPPLPPPPAPRVVQPSSDLQIVKHANHGAVALGQAITYTMTVTNHGPDAATDARITDTPSTTMKVLSAKTAHGSCKVSGRLLRCSLGKISNGKSIKITVRARVKTVGTEQNAASVTSASGDPKPGNNLSKVRTQVKPVLRLHKSASPKTVKVGGTVTYHLKVSNPTSVAITKVKVCDRLPRGLSFRSAKPRANRSKGRECWTIQKLGAHKSRTLTVHAKALSGASGARTNHATAVAKGVTGASAKATVRIAVMPVLRVRKIASRKTITAGHSITYRIMVSASNASAHGVKVCDALPLGLSFRSAHPKARLSKGRECWTIRTLRKGTSRTFTVHARALRGARGRKTNHAIATARGARTGRGRATVTVKAAPTLPTPVTG